MKSFLALIVFFLSTVGNSAMSSEALLVHRYSEGLVPPFLNHSASCNIFSDRIEVERNYAGVTSSQTIPVKFSLQSLAVLQGKMRKAAEGKIETTLLPTDIPFNGYYANAIEHAPSVVLKAVQSSQGMENKAEEAVSLIKLIDAHCPNLE